MAAEHYIVKGNGWEVRISPLGFCTVLQSEPGEPEDAPAVSWVTPGRFRVRCLGCGAEIVVTPRVAPVCRSCRG